MTYDEILVGEDNPVLEIPSESERHRFIQLEHGIKVAGRVFPIQFVELEGFNRLTTGARRRSPIEIRVEQLTDASCV